MGIFGLAAPVFNDFGYPIAYITVGGPASRLTERLVEQIIPHLLREPQGLSYDLGYGYTGIISNSNF